MKKSIIMMMALFVTVFYVESVEAQQLPSGGDRSFEITVSPFSTSPVSFTQLRLRQFQSTDSALRLRGGLNYNSERINEDNRDSRFYLTLAPGMEWHAIQEDRVSIYYGAEVPVTYVTSRAHRGDVTNVNVDGGEHFGLGVNALVGLDVYFLNRLYTGVEVLYGITFRSYLDAEVNGNEIENDSNEFIFGQSAISRFRLGFTF